MLKFKQIISSSNNSVGLFLIIFKMFFGLDNIQSNTCVSSFKLQFLNTSPILQLNPNDIYFKNIFYTYITMARHDFYSMKTQK